MSGQNSQMSGGISFFNKCNYGILKLKYHFISVVPHYLQQIQRDNQLIIFHHQSSTMATAADDFGEVYTGGQGGQGGPGGQGEEQDFFAAQGNNNAEAPAAGAPGN